MKHFFILTITFLPLFFMACERNNVNPDNTNDNFNNDTSSYKPKVVNNAVTDIEGNVYDAVEINGRMWMNSNLKTKKYANGTNISWNFDYCYPNNDLSNIDKYGVLYRWDIATENQASSPSSSGRLCDWESLLAGRYFLLTDTLRLSTYLMRSEPERSTLDGPERTK